MTTVLCVALAAPALQAGESQRKLIILVLIDAMRADHVHCYGYKRETTPNIDAMAEQGRRYTRVFTNAPWTRPSTTSFLTGYNASRHRNETSHSTLRAGVVTLAERLKKLGYTTAGFVANGNGGSLAGLQRGFDVFHDPTRTYIRGTRGKTYCCNGLPTGEFIVRHALRWLRRDHAKKTFLFMFMVDPHDPYGAPPALEHMFLGNFKGRIRRTASWEYHNNYPPDERFSMQAIYDAGIRYADKAFGEFVHALRRRHLYKNATIMVTADHGEGFGEHGYYLHAHHFYNEILHIPLIIKGARFAPGVDTRLTQPIDVTRTILQLAGGTADDLPGHSLLEPPVAHPYVISEYNEFGIHRQAIVGPRYKVIWQRPADEAWFMRAVGNKKYFPSVSFDHDVVHVYDLIADPKEEHNLAENPPPAAQALLRKLRAFVNESRELASR